MDSAVPVRRSSRLVCFDPAREVDCRGALKALGLAVDPVEVASSKLISHIRLTQPDVVVIDLEKLPSHGRTVGVVLRTTKSTQAIPIVFLGGAPDKVAQVRAAIPDAVCGPWSQAKALIGKARPGKAAVVPHMKQWAGSTLEKKLGIGTGVVTVIGAPPTFELNAPSESRVTARTKLTIWFVRSRAELEREIEFMALHPPLWVAFPKQSGGHKADFTQHDVRAAANAAGLVDNKICAIDEDWSAMRFALRKLQ